MSLLNELKERRTAVSAEMDRLEEQGNEIDRKWKEQERLFEDLDAAIFALDPSDPPNMLDDAALEAPAQPVHPEAELRSVTPATEEASGDQLDALGQAGVEVETPLGHEPNAIPDAVETDQPEVPDVEETLPGDEADAEFRELPSDEWFVTADQSEELPSPINDEPTSVLNDPELQAAVDRANASIAQDEPRRVDDLHIEGGYFARFSHPTVTETDAPLPPADIEQSEPAYVGCIDEELERDYDAAKARTTIQHEDAKKPFFAFLGAKPKPEEVC